MTPGYPIEYPSELQSAICAQIYAACLPPEETSLDPLILSEHGIPTSLPSSLPPSHWPEPVTRHALSSLCLVNHAWYEAAKPWLWRKLEVRLPRSWLSLVEEIAWDHEEETVDKVMEETVRAAARAAMASAAKPRMLLEAGAEQKLEESILDSIRMPEDPIPLELLSPMASREPSPRRFRTKSQSPARWELVRSISDAIQNVIHRNEPGVYVPTIGDPCPGRHVRHLDFNHFRTIGMRRSVDEGVNSRFVTGDRVEAILKEMPNLTEFGATEYMDGALTLPVLNELFLRGAPSRGRGRPSRGRALISDVEEGDRERRRECLELEAIDFTGCVSGVFVNALTEFVATHLLPAESIEGDDRLARLSLEEPLVFPGLRRLGLRGVKSVLPETLAPFVMAFPSLTHLDLSGTRVNPELLQTLGQSPSVRLQSLALARCVRLSGQSIRSFLIDSPVCAALRELNLYGDMTFVSPLTEEDLTAIVSQAPCFLSNNLVYLDLSSAPLTKSVLDVCRPLSKLRSLGLSYIPDLSTKTIASFIIDKAPNVEVLTLINTSRELDCGMRPDLAANVATRGSVRQSCFALHSDIINPLCVPLFSFSLTSDKKQLPPTNLRVIELSTILLGGLGAGAGSWRIIKSKGGRGWYVDTASGWVAEVEGQSTLRRDLEPDHPLRLELGKMSDANGNVSSGIGWHARKMEILHGQGMLGREDGLYGAVSFAYQG
ncbi:hypothetical protein K435DRAFT_748230 [Dendrothele bispora CBS 962.96]|uniref:F-box domain-containing protein n=1 Tax=Dendrothele bispora (strain CBS 962.96) TaxID=1314807 RepID=A0A4S8MKT0_DENBC|nr:hypothetical protein K435DRAFT_748230 [Dendrothele bispora CBS 962.96]